MKKQIAAGLAALTALLVNSAHASVSSLDDLNYWGTGAHRAALVIDWNDGKTDEALAWGYRWDGDALTVADMLLGLVALDNRMFVRIDSSGSYGLAIFGIGFRSGSAPFGVTGTQDMDGNSVVPVFNNGVSDTNFLNGAMDAPLDSSFAGPSNQEDHYREGWNNGFWELLFSGTDNFSSVSSETYPDQWSSALIGSDGAALEDGGWYAFSITGSDFSTITPGAPAAASVPEPCSAVLIICGFAGWILSDRKRRNNA